MRKHNSVFAALILICMVGSKSAYAQKAHFFPDDGDLYYDGSHYADSWFSWVNPGNWTFTYAGYESDISLDETYFDSCTSWTDLPDPYDDCPTAGVDDPAGKKNFGIGSFAAESIQPQSVKVYTGQWRFSGGSGIRSHVNYGAQEVSRTLCPWKDIWCYNGVKGTSLKETDWNYAEESYVEWYYSQY